MKNLKVYKKGILCIGVSFILAGSLTMCSKQTTEVTNSNPEFEHINDKPAPNYGETDVTNTKEETADNATKYVNELKSEVMQIKSSDEYKDVKSSIKEKFITVVDFIFYDEPINGIYYDNLKEETKLEITSNVNEVDGYIEKYEPNYKEKLSEQKGKAKSWLTGKMNKLSEYVEGKVDEETWNEIIDAKEETKEAGLDGWNAIKDLASDVKGDISEKYQNYKQR